MSKLQLNEEAWKDFEILINAYLDATEPILQKDKFIIPMAMVLNKESQPHFVALQPDESQKKSDTATHLDAYRKLLRQLPDNTHACLLGYDIRIDLNGFQDAIAIELEHKNGELQRMVAPYKFEGLLKKKLVMGQSKLTEAPSEHILNRN